jgi:hypothetical protein
VELVLAQKLTRTELFHVIVNKNNTNEKLYIQGMPSSPLSRSERW